MLEVQRQSEICELKVVLLGNMFVGKTSLALRFAKGQFNPKQDNTIGAAFLTKTVSIDDTTIRLNIWDTAGQERYKSIVGLYYRGAQAAIVVYDITDEETFEGAKKWIKELRRELGPQTLIVLAGNKQDLANMRMVTCEEAQAYADENKLIFMETSAKTAINVNEIFLAIAKTLFIKNGQSDGGPGRGRRLSRSDAKAKSSSGCCK